MSRTTSGEGRFVKVSLLCVQQLCGFFPLLHIPLSYNNPAVRGITLTARQACMLYRTNNQKRPCYRTCAIGERCVTWLMVVVSQGLNRLFPRMLYTPNALL